LLVSHPDIRGKPVNVKIYVVNDFFKQKILVDEITIRENRRMDKKNYGHSRRGHIIEYRDKPFCPQCYKIHKKRT